VLNAGDDVVVVGGGVIGLAVSWRLAADGARVTVCDPEPGRGASWAAAGMLAPITEASRAEAPLTRLGMASARRWPEFARAVHDDSDLDVGFRDEGTLAVAYDDDDRRAFDELHAVHLALGLPSDRVGAREARRLEPLLSPRIRGGLWVAGDRQVDNRALVAALLAAGSRRGVRLEGTRVARLCVEAGRCRGVALADGRALGAGQVVLAAGSWSGLIDGLPDDARPPVRPVKGEILRLRGAADDPVLAHTVRAKVQGRDVYLVPRRGGELVVGATVEEAGYDTRVRAGGVLDLLQAAVTVLPAVAELELDEVIARLRPASPDNAPILGPTPVAGLVLATGHHRNGVLLTPVTVDAVSELLNHGALPEVAAPFTLARFR